jgi:hypothetical protein
MKLGNGTKLKKEMTKREKNRRNNIRRITVSAAVAFVIFIALLVIQSSILNQEEKQQVYQVTNDITSGTKITEDNIGDFLALKEVQLSLIPDGYITDSAEIVGKFVNRNYKAKDVITSDGLTDTETIYMNNIENPTEVSFSVESLSSSVAGTIREGDYINIYGTRSASVSGETSITNNANDIIVDNNYTFKHIYIAKAYASDGTRILTAEGDGLTASLFSVVIDESDVDTFYAMIANCTLRLAKLEYQTDTDYQGFLIDTNATAATVETSNSAASNENVVVDYTPVETEATTSDENVVDVIAEELKNSTNDTVNEISETGDVSVTTESSTTESSTATN